MQNNNAQTKNTSNNPINLWHNTKVGNFNVVIEMPKGTKNKYEINKKTGKIELDRKLNVTAPVNYGFFPKTLAMDKDPLDVIVMGPKLKRGQIVSIKPVAILKMIDKGKQDDKVLAAPKDSKVVLKDIPKPLLNDIEHFLKHGKGKKTKLFKWLPAKKAKEEIALSKKRYKNVLRT